MTNAMIYNLPGCVQARKIGREAAMNGNARRWRVAMLLMRRAMTIHAAAKEAAQ